MWTFLAKKLIIPFHVIHGEVLIGPLLLVLVIGLVLRRPKPVEHSLMLGQAGGVGVKCGLWSCYDPSLIWIGSSWSSSLTLSVTLILRALDLELSPFSHPLLEPEILLAPDGDL